MEIDTERQNDVDKLYRINTKEIEMYDQYNIGIFEQSRKYCEYRQKYHR